MVLLHIGACLGLLLDTACGSGSPITPSVLDRESAEVAPLVPRRCAKRQGECMPPVAWVNKLCQGVHPEVALHMFRGGSPWTRLYALANAPAFNGAGGPSVLDEPVMVHEELIALRRHGTSRALGSGDISIGDTAGYDVLRWNGSCVTLHDGEFERETPKRRRHAKVEWRWLGDETRAALRRSEVIVRAFRARKEECKGATFGAVSKACVERDEHLVAAIVQYVRAGGKLPEPRETL